MRAIDILNVEKVKQALKRSADPYNERYKEQDLLDYALGNNSYEIVRLLLDQYPHFSVTKERLFRYATSDIHESDPDIIELLLQKGNLSINLTDEEGKTLMHHALRDAQLFEIKYLLGKNIDLGIKDHQGLTSLDTAKKWLQIYEELNRQTPWDETRRKIMRVKQAIEKLENHSISPSH